MDVGEEAATVALLASMSEYGVMGEYGGYVVGVEFRFLD